GAKAVKAAMNDVEKKSDGGRMWRRVHGLWVLERTGNLDPATLADALRDPNAPVRVHAQRILTGREKWEGPGRAAAIAGLRDPDADVRRNAAHALGRHPGPENLRPLLDLRRAVPPEDTHLLHVVRVALRDQFPTPLAWVDLAATRTTEADLLAV